jgi:sialic acid synthase
VSKALTFKEGPMAEIEIPQRNKLKRVQGVHFN